MIRNVFTAGIALVVLGMSFAHATSVYLTLVTSDPELASGTFTVFAQTSDLNNLGIAAFSVDINATGGVTIAKAAITSQTNSAPNPPFSLIRSPGTLSGVGFANRLTSITAAQDNIGAVGNDDDSSLGYGYGEVGMAQGTFVGSITGKGLLQVATGRWTDSGFGGMIFATGTLDSFGLFPTNWEANGDSPDQGSTQFLIAATSVVQSVPGAFTGMIPTFPEPPSLVLMGLAGLGLVVVGRRRSK